MCPGGACHPTRGRRNRFARDGRGCVGRRLYRPPHVTRRRIDSLALKPDPGQRFMVIVQGESGGSSPQGGRFDHDARGELVVAKHALPLRGFSRIKIKFARLATILPSLSRMS